ncbi:MAG: hypothetical protein ABWY78_23420, partial [Microvirga sp.]
ETAFDLSSVAGYQPAGTPVGMIAIPSERGRPGTLVLRRYRSIAGDGGPILQEICGSILLQNAPAGSAN